MSRTARFTLTLSQPSINTVSVDWETVDGTAVAPSDYTAASGTVTFEPGETEKTVDITIRNNISGNPEEQFTVELSNPVLVSIGDGIGTCTIPGSLGEYADRFTWMYTRLKTAENGYFGPPTGAKARTMPYHCPEYIVAEAPAWGHESVSETASFWVGLEAWRGLIANDWDGYNAAWTSIETNYIPNATNQPVGTYSALDPADYQPEGDLPSDYPVLGDSEVAVGVDALAGELETTYGNKRMYLMHWSLDVDGKYGFHNGDGAEVAVHINNFQRGLQESTFEAITFPCWEDWSFGDPDYGFLPLFAQGKPTYPEAEFDYSKQWRYTCAPDAEARALQWAFWGAKFAAERSSASSVATATAKAKKMGDYLRYALFDKYFRKIGDDRDEGADFGDPYASCHFLVSWYVSWGGEVPAPSSTSSWGFRIGSSESHHGYQAPDAAYFMATGGGGFSPDSESAGDIWLGSLYRQIEMIRWLQSPEGPIAGGVTNSWLGRYETPTDGRETAQFYGMYYTYSPVWHDPPSNNWFGFQCWGLGRSADLFLEVSDKSTTLANAIRPNLEIILDRWVNWVLDNVTVEEADFEVPDTLSWVSETEVEGETTTAANLEGVYEYLPTLDWDDGGDYGAFWNASTVPNPNLHCSIVKSGRDLGVASELAFVLIHYAEAKRRMDKFTDTIPNGAHTAEEAYELAKALLDVIWDNFRDSMGIAVEEERADYARMGDPVYVPSTFEGEMPNGDLIEEGATFVSLRSFIMDEPEWPQIAAYIAEPETAPVPTFTYHRFWAQCAYAMACAAMQRYFGDLV